MKLHLYFLILSIGFGNFAFGQRTITGTVSDAKTGQPISLVNLIADYGPVGTTTGQDGRFSLVVNRMPLTIRFSHIAYEAKTLTFNKYPEKSIQIRMEPRVESIGEVVVEGGKYIQVLKRENFYVSDYEFDQDKIWVVGYANKSILKPQLIVLDLDRRILQKQPIEGRTKLYKDAFGRVHLLDKESIVGIDYVQNQIRIGEPKMFTGWEQNLFDLQMVLGKSGIFKWVYNNGIYCEYVAIDFKDTIAEVIHKAYDRDLFPGEEPAKSFRHSSIPRIMFPKLGADLRMEATFDPSDAFTARAQEQVTYRPIITHIYRFRNSFLIFENRGCHLWKYDISFRDPADLKIVEPKNAENTDLLQDPVTGNLYLNYTINSIGYLAGVDPQTGAIQFTRKLENYIRGDNVKVYNNRAWFTHQNVNGSSLMNLYSTEIGGN
ncbi:MAG: carboxypeptidase-like regulatory domain-containing protein [Porphyromonadaceae bacterium]|nr:MAG: carboxypeptidase-like regulatory domain-containing protein [Porphyromonadaceae bacterium]